MKNELRFYNHSGTSLLAKGCFLLLVILTLCGNVTTAQNAKKVLTGIVKDTSGEPIIGATVTIKGKNIGSSTDLKGEYTINNPGQNPILIISYIGMKTKTIAVGNKTRVDVVLEEEATALDEVVAIGYAFQRKSDITGSLSSLKSDDIATTAATTLEQSLAGRVSGVRVAQDYSPGGGVSIQIRGSNSMLGGTEPLYVVDGMPLEPVSDAQGNNSAGESIAQSSMSFINPDDIESMEILKDASATAIYGARGANGVVLITTKAGKSGRASVSYNFRSEISNVSRKIDLMNASEFCQMLNQKELNRYYLETTKPGYTGVIEPIDLPYNGINNPLPWDMPNTDWQDAVFQTAFSQNHSIQVQGSTSKDNKYFVSLGYRKQDGVIIETNYDRLSLNASFDQRISKKFTISNKLNASYSTSNGTTSSNGEVFANRSVVTGAMLMQPIFALDKESTDPNEDEEYGDFNGNYNVNNPYRLATQVKDKKINYTIVDAVTGTYDITKGLTATAKVGINYTNSERYQYWPSSTTRGKAADGIATVATLGTLKYIIEGRANYDKKFGNHSISAMGAFTLEDNSKQTRYDTYAGFPSDDLSYYGINDARDRFPTEMDWYSNKLISFISRLNYNYKQRYMATVTFRADGSTRFAENKKWGYFPSVALAWRVSEEKFMAKTSKYINNLKLRASYGQTGSESGINQYMSLGILKTNPYSFDNSVADGYVESNIPNPFLTWETTDQFDIGMDVTLFNSKVMLTVDLYYKITRDLLQSVNMPGSFGYTTKIMNMGRVDNKGLEFEITVPIYKTRNSSLTVTGNGAFNANKIVSLGSRNFILGPNVGSFRVNRFMEGQPLGTFWGLEWDGVYANWDEAQASGIYNAIPGEYRFKNNSVDYQTNSDGSFALDENGSKIPLAVQQINERDMVKIGDPNPDFTYGMNLSFNYKKFDMSVLLSGQVGGSLYWNDYSLMVQQTRNYNSLSSALKDSWIAPMEYTFMANGKQYTIGNRYGNTNNASLPSARANNGLIGGVSTGYRNSLMNSSLLFDASYLKISSVNIGYTFKIPSFATSLRLGLSVNNLWTFSSYPGYDPASNSFVKSPMRQGIDIGSYPSQRTYSLSVALNL